MFLHRSQHTQIALNSPGVVIADVALNHLNKLLLAGKTPAIIYLQGISVSWNPVENKAQTALRATESKRSIPESHFHNMGNCRSASPSYCVRYDGAETVDLLSRTDPLL